MEFPDHVMHHINVAVVAMILSKTYGYGFVDDIKCLLNFLFILFDSSNTKR